MTAYTALNKFAEDGLTEAVWPASAPPGKGWLRQSWVYTWQWHRKYVNINTEYTTQAQNDFIPERYYCMNMRKPNSTQFNIVIAIANSVKDVWRVWKMHKQKMITEHFWVNPEVIEKWCN